MNDIIGSKWWRFDFHIHTPASKDYKELELSCTDWLKVCMEKGLDCVVVTDHNSGEWIDKINVEYNKIKSNVRKPIWFKPLVIYPGVELTVSQGADRVHLLAILDPSKGTSEITALLGECGIRSDFGDDQNVSTIKSFEETVEIIMKHKGIPIPAHIDGPKGFLFNYKESKGATVELKRSLKHVYAVELCNPCAFDNADQSIKEEIKNYAIVTGSDAHLSDEILQNGSTWLKMSEPSIESLHLALTDFEYCVKNQEENPNIDPEYYIKSLQIKKMKHCGRADGKPFDINFNTHLNTLIGGRGTGKSTIIESLRIATERDNELEKFDSLYKQINKFKKKDEDGGVMLDDTSLQLDYFRNGKDYRILSSSSGTSLQEKNGSNWEISSTEYEQTRFPIRIYSQKQINSMAEHTSAILNMIDEAISVEDLNNLVRQYEDEYLKKSIDERKLTTAINDKAHLESRIRDIENDLKQYEEKGHSDILKRYQKRISQQESIKFGEDYCDLDKKIDEIIERFEPSEFPIELFQSDDFEVEMKRIYDTASAGLSKVKENLQDNARQIKEIILKHKKDIESSDWFADVNKSNQDYDDLKKSYSQKGSVINLTLYDDWAREKSQVEQKIEDLKKYENQLKDIKQDKDKQRKLICEKRKELHEKRSGFINKVLVENQYVKMELIYLGDYENLEKNFRELLGFENNIFQEVILDIDNASGILWKLYQSQKNGSYEDIIKNITNLKEQISEIINKKSQSGINKKFSNKIERIFSSNPEKIDKFQCWLPEDKLIVKYAENSKDNKYYPLSVGSAGQKAAAILAFLLSYGNDPIVIDQPEDDLDTELITELIVKQLHENKNKRQIIVVTHNPNIVVNGDAELVHVLKFTGQVEHDCTGGLGELEIRNRICEIMEGGRIAFEKRFKRITILGME